MRATTLCLVSAGIRTQVPGMAWCASTPTVRSASPERMWMIAGRADVCSESCSPGAKANSTSSIPFSFESVWLRMPRAGTGASATRSRNTVAGMFIFSGKRGYWARYRGPTDVDQVTRQWTSDDVAADRAPMSIAACSRGAVLRRG